MKPNRWKVTMAIAAGVFVLLVAGGRVIYIDFPYRGKIVDKETKRPIEGAAVVAVWWTETFTPVQGIISFYEASETITDRNGNFTTPWLWGVSINPLKNVRPAQFTIFKPGYETYNDRHLERAFIGQRTVLEFRRLTTRKERLRNQSGLILGSRVPDARIPNLIRLRNIERIRLGLKPVHVPSR